MSKIRVLDQHIADKIAAGEVVERPVSVVKELLENSLDAQAAFIEVTIKDGGVGLIRVKDDGLGMDGDDLAVAFERHATSKIADFNDLFTLNTFGFRGEALPSIAAVAQVEMTSTPRGGIVGHTIRLSGGVAPEIMEVGGSGGTTVEVKNLFYNIPARRKFLKSSSYETGLIGELISKYALGHCQVRFKLTVNGQTTIDTAGLNTVEERLAYFYGEAVTPQIVPVAKTEFMPGHFVEAWLLKEEITRNNRNQETFFVNGRLIKSMELNHILEEGYYTLIAKGRFPVAVVKLTLPGQQLDVNIHPAKLEIKINELGRMRTLLVEIFKDALWEASISKNAFLLDDQRLAAQMAYQQKSRPASQPKTSPQPAASAAPQKSAPAKAPEKRLEQGTLDFDLPKPIEQALHVKESIAEFQASPSMTPPAAPKPQAAPREAVSPLDTAATELAVQPTATIKDIDELTVLGQLNQSFIIAQNKEGLYIIDQHTCHERILYERFMREEDSKEVQIESLLIPVTVNLTPQQDSVLIKHILTLQELGFIVENFGERSYLLRALPLGLGGTEDIERMFIDLIDDLGSSKNVTPAVIKEKLVTTASCKGAVKARWKLSEVEMMTLLHDLARVENAHTCPHGRPIIYKLSMKELYAIFKRGAYPYD